MTIALIAHDSKKELMVQFCTAYCRILSQHKLVATGTTGKLIAEATGLQVQRFLAGVQGGDQQIASRIVADYDKRDLVCNSFPLHAGSRSICRIPVELDNFHWGFQRPHLR